MLVSTFQLLFIMRVFKNEILFLFLSTVYIILGCKMKFVQLFLLLFEYKETIIDESFEVCFHL